MLVSEALRELQLPRVADHVLTHEEGEEVVSADLPPIRVLDVCTGSGCIACAIASEYPAAQVIALDIADEAVKLAKETPKSLACRIESKFVRVIFLKRSTQVNMAALICSFQILLTFQLRFWKDSKKR